MGNEQQNEGRFEQVRGTVKEAIGDATNNERMQYEGELDKAKGNVREGVGDVREGLEDMARDLDRETDQDSSR
jgi:uncharacterized protein YjbJ (UPF0337 family)